ncbi:MAG: hypothetical protein LC104_02780 [Bacteroidales bacterium]|nr:hypothetical protein [Bacteroidales bacterium]
MSDRRSFLRTTAATPFLSTVPIASARAAPAATPRKKLAVITTVWYPGSHAWHMAERFLHGYPIHGQWHHPPFEVVSAYVDQVPQNDVSRARAKEFGFTIYPTIAETLRCGGKQLAVDAVLTIGEHGEYPLSDIGQKKYPRYEFFKQATDVMAADGRVVPMFNDKHLSWNWDWAKEMVAISKKMKIPFIAGSSLPHTWRMPSVEMPLGAEITELVGVGFSRVDHYDFHALEMMQCLAERRKGGETGVQAIQAYRGEAFWKAMQAGSWSAGGWDARLFEACLCRSQTLVQHGQFSHRHPTFEQMRQSAREPVAYRIEYTDGLKATMLLLSGVVEDFSCAAHVQGRAEPFSTLFHLPPRPNVTYSTALMAQAEQTFLTGKPAHPLERTLLTSGLVTAGMTSLAQNGKRLSTPHLAVKYQPQPESTFLRD